MALRTSNKSCNDGLITQKFQIFKKNWAQSALENLLLGLNWNLNGLLLSWRWAYIEKEINFHTKNLFLDILSNRRLITWVLTRHGIARGLVFGEAALSAWSRSRHDDFSVAYKIALWMNLAPKWQSNVKYHFGLCRAWPRGSVFSELCFRNIFAAFQMRILIGWNYFGV